MKTILVPLDGTPLAEQVLPYVQLLAPLLGAPVHLLRAISDVEQAHLLADAAAARERGGPPLPSPVCAQCTLAASCQHMGCYISGQATRLAGTGVKTYADMRLGAPASVTAVAAAQWPEPLIAMATHDDQGLWRWARGSVADQLVHTTRIPMLLVRGHEHATQPAPRLKRILVPLDGSPLARQALPLALELAALAHAELILLQALAPSIDAYLRDYPLTAEPRRALEEQAQQAFERFADAGERQSMQLTTAVGVGSPATAIVEEVLRRRIDLIVMATHGYSGLQRWRLGSVAAEVLRLTSTPLILVRGQPGAHVADGISFESMNG
jgi:nucleotide-binding universal stress UspA family protein